MLQMWRKCKFRHNCHPGPKRTTYNIGHQHCTTSTQHCLNIVSTLVTNIGYQHCENALITQQCLKDVSIDTTFTICWLNIVSVLVDVSQHCGNTGTWSKYNIGTTFTQHCLDIHITLLECLKVSTKNHATTLGADVETTLVPVLPQCCHNLGALAGKMRWTSIIIM